MVAILLVVAQDRPPPPGIEGDGRGWGAVELLVLAAVIAGLLWLITRASRRQKGGPSPRARP